MKHKYRHYKGGIYTLLGLGRHSETLEPLVIYQNEHGDLWARPSGMFFEKVIVDGVAVPRFELIKDEK